MLASGMEMLCAGVGLIIAGSLRGEWSSVDLAAIQWRSIAAFAYLLVFGSLIGFSAYIWLLRRVSPAAVSTYAYVNPMVAVLLGWWLAHEAVGLRTWVAAGLIIAAVVMITLRRNTPAAAPNLPKAPREQASPSNVAPPAAGRLCALED
jgi:drug/metabolite transporter (DMT)-like permease